jgi:hypothetical protein
MVLMRILFDAKDLINVVALPYAKVFKSLRELMAAASLLPTGKSN